MTRHEKALDILRKGTFIPATLLALDKEGNFDENTQKALMRYYLDCGVGGIATAVHSTQFAIRLPQYNLFERVLKLVSATIDEYEKQSGKTIVKISGICGDTEQAVREAETIVRYGYDAALLSPGGLDDMSEQELIKRTEAVAKIIPVIGFYLQPSVGGRVFSYKYWQGVCETENVVAIKAAPFNRYFTEDVVRAAVFSSRSDKIALYTGNDDNIITDLLAKYRFVKEGKTIERSFDGGLLGHWSVWTKTAVDIFRRIKSGERSEEMLILANEITDANSAFFDTANNFKGCIAGLHEVLRRQGLFQSTRCLDPHECMSAGQAEEIDRVYRMYPHLNDDDFVKANISGWREKQV